jgi:hypothetical protein
LVKLIKRQELRGFVKQGKSLKAIAYYYGVSESTIRRKIKRWKIRASKKPFHRKQLKLPRRSWVPTRLIQNNLEAEFKFINIQHPPYSWFNQRTLVFSNSPRYPKGSFDVLTIYYVGEVSDVYFLFPIRVGLPNAPVGFQEAFAFAQANAKSILEQSLERSAVLARRIVGFALSRKMKKRRLVKLR